MPLRARKVPVWLLGLYLLAGCGYSSDEELFGVIDSVPPRVEKTIPGQGWIQVPPSITARVWFSEAVDPVSIGPDSILLLSGEYLSMSVYLVETEAEGRGVVSIDPQDSLLPGVEYLLWIGPGVTDRYGNPLESETRIVFQTLR